MKKKINNVKTTLQPHSKAKVDFLKAYLGRYLRILNRVNSVKQINLFDVFCGMGIYDDGGKGSPIVMFDTIVEIANDEPNLLQKVKLYFNDIEKDKIDNVKSYVDANNKSNIHVECFNCDVQEMFELVIQKTNTVYKDSSNLVFIDPYGYKDIKRDILVDLLQNTHTEIMLFLPISHMYRFTDVAQKDTETAQYKPLREFVESFFTEEHPIRNQKIEDVHEYIAYLKKAFSFNNKRHTASYYLERDKNSFFALFFMNSHIYGLEKILEVKWELNNENGKGFNQTKPPSLFDDEFANDVKEDNFEQLKEIIIHALKEHKTRTNIELYRLAIVNEFLPKHANDVLKYLQDGNQISVFDIAKQQSARKGAFYLGWDNHKNNHNNPKINITLKQ